MRASGYARVMRTESLDRPRPQAALRSTPWLHAARLGMLVGVVLLATFATPTRAQSLPALLPDDVEVAVGLIDLNDVTDRIEPFLAEAERVGLVDAIVGALPAAEGTSTDDMDAL